MTIARRLVWVGIALAGLGLALPAAAQNYPNRVIRVVSAHAPGGGADIIIRHLAEKLQAAAGKTVIVENKPGANGAIGISTLLHAKPDGYTIMINVSSAVVGNTYFMKDADYNPAKDMTPVAPVGQNAYVLVTNAKTGAKTVADVLAHARAKPTKFGIQSTSAQISMELLKLETGVNFVQANYRGATAVLGDLTAGEIDFAFGDPTTTLGQVRQGRVVPIAVTSKERTTGYPTVPTIAESGVPTYDFVVFWGVWAPAGTPPEVTAKLEGWFKTILANEETRQFLERNGIDPMQGDGRMLATMVEHDMAQWGLVASKVGIVRQ